MTASAQYLRHVLRGRLMRIVPRQNESINECWIADRDRFSYEGIYSSDRLTKPMVRGANGSVRETDWQAALEAAANGLKAVAAERLGILAGALEHSEEYALLAQIAAGLGTANIDIGCGSWISPPTRPIRRCPRWAARSPMSMRCRAC